MRLSRFSNITFLYNLVKENPYAIKDWQTFRNLSWSIVVYEVVVTSPVIINNNR